MTVHLGVAVFHRVLQGEVLRLFTWEGQSSAECCKRKSCDCSPGSGSLLQSVAGEVTGLPPATLYRRRPLPGEQSQEFPLQHSTEDCHSQVNSGNPLQSFAGGSPVTVHMEWQTTHCGGCYIM